MQNLKARTLRPIASRHVAAAKGVEQGVLYATISAGMVLARPYLTGRGIDQGFADRYGSAYGRTAAKVYRAEHGTEPRKAWSNVNGKWRRVNGYLPTETAVLDTAFATYKRTAEYVVTAPASVAEVTVPVESFVCRVPGCDGVWHNDGVCETTLADVTTPNASLIVNVSAEDDETVQLVVWEGSDGRDLIRTTDQAQARAFADRLRELAVAVDRGADLLAVSALTTLAAVAA